MKSLITEEKYRVIRTSDVGIDITAYTFSEPTGNCVNILEKMTEQTCENIFNESKEQYYLEDCKYGFSIYKAKTDESALQFKCGDSWDCPNSYPFIAERPEDCLGSKKAEVCFRNYAISHDDPTICQSAYNSEFQKDESGPCYLYFALKENDLDACSKIPEPDPNRYLCNAIILAEAGE